MPFRFFFYKRIFTWISDTYFDIQHPQIPCPYSQNFFHSFLPLTCGTDASHHTLIRLLLCKLSSPVAMPVITDFSSCGKQVKEIQKHRQGWEMKNPKTLAKKGEGPDTWATDKQSKQANIILP